MLSFGNICHKRRQLAKIGLFAGWIVPVSAANAQKRAATEPIVQPVPPNTQTFIERAFEMRRLALELGDQPYGAIVVRDGKVVGQSWSRVVLDSDPTGHAEISAIRDAARRGADLSGAILISSSRPCAMCEAAAAWCGISEMISGKAATSAGAPRQC